MAKKKDKHEILAKKAIAYIIIGVAILGAIVAGIYLSKNFKYNGIEFQKNYQGKILLYTATFPVMDYQGNIGKAAVDFRNDPRTLRDIDVNLEANLGLTKSLFISYPKNSELTTCEDNGIAAANLGVFFKTAGLSVKAGINDPDYKNSSIPYINCDTHSNNTVIMLRQSNETSINQFGRNCIVIKFKECEMIRATEKFELSILETWVKNF